MRTQHDCGKLRAEKVLFEHRRKLKVNQVTERTKPSNKQMKFVDAR